MFLYMGVYCLVVLVVDLYVVVEVFYVDMCVVVVLLDG